jgi:hypothetical protein
MNQSDIQSFGPLPHASLRDPIQTTALYLSSSIYARINIHCLLIRSPTLAMELRAHISLEITFRGTRTPFLKRLPAAPFRGVPRPTSSPHTPFVIARSQLRACEPPNRGSRLCHQTNITDSIYDAPASPTAQQNSQSEPHKPYHPLVSPS